jgi:CDP-glucose 4,6-dehydratase
MEDLVTLWKDRRVLVTGHTGFKGGWLSHWLASSGAHVRGYSLDPSTEPNLFTTASVASVVEDTRGDVRDYSNLEAAIRGFRPEVVFHLAAQPIVLRSYVDPLTTYSTNVLGTANLLEAVRQNDCVRAVVCVISDKCYQNQEWVWPYRETDPLGGFDPYSSSKACADMICAAYRSSFFPPSRFDQHRVALATVRAGNVIGGGDWSADRLIPDLIRGFHADKPTIIRRPKAVRPWQHVLGPLHGYIQLAEKLLTDPARFSSPFNFGPGEDDAWPVDRIANRVAELWGNGAAWVLDASTATVHEDHYLRLDSSKAKHALGWQPQLAIDAALEWTVAWYRAWHQREDMSRETLRQIEAYKRLIA